MVNEVIIPYGIKTINNDTFYNCTALRKITIPRSVKSIGSWAFAYCNNLKDVYYTGSEEDWKKINIGYINECLKNATIHYGYKSTDKSIDDYIIKEVKKYTSDGDYAQFDSIISSSISYEEKLRRLNELFKNNGFTDAKEGIKYLSETTSYRSDYRYLTTNEIYCSYNFLYWLYNTKKGLAARSALYTSGLIFNYEVFDYMNLGTYAESEYPGVKKNKALLKKIMESNNDSTVCDVLDYSNKTAKFLKNLITLNGLEDKAELVDAVDKMKTYTTKAEFDKAVDVFCDKVAHYIEASVDADKVYLDASNFKEALDTSANIISFAGATTEDIVAMVNLNNDIETYKKYSKFLTYIYNNKDLSFEMRLAAYQILDDINNGYFNRVISIIGNCFELADGFIYTDKTKLQYALEGMGMSSEGSSLLNSAFKTIKLATYISNIVVDTGDFVKQVAYTQGYAELSTLYAMKLEEDKKAFLANQSAENAWGFFEDYTILWNLRYQGEQQYLDMGKVKMYILAKVPTFNYNQKVDIVSDTLEHLEKCKFTIADNVEIPKSVQYVKKAVVKCPVDVYVYNSDGEIIAVLKDGIESDLTNEYGRFTVMRESYSGEYSKIICQSTNDDLKIKMVAIGNGLVDYQSASVDSDETKEIDKLIVNTDDVIEVNNEKYIVDTNGDGNTDLEGDLLTKNDDEYIKAERIELSYDDLTLLAGKSQTLGAKIYPQNTTNTGIEWISLNPSVAVVKNGVVTGIGEGSTNIIARVCDSEEIEYEMTVNVIDKIENQLNGYNFNNGILTINTYSKNNTSEPVSAVRYIGLYSSDNALKKIVSVPVCLEREKDESKDILINNYTYENGDYIKSFIWNSELYPYSISKTLLLESN